MSDSKSTEELRRKLCECLNIFPEEIQYHLPVNIGESNIRDLEQLFDQELAKREAQARLRGAIDCSTFVIQHDESSFRQERAWFKIKPKLFLDYQVKLMREIEEPNNPNSEEMVDFAIEVITQWGHEPAEGIYTSGGLSTLETAFSILRRRNMLNSKGQYVPAELVKATLKTQTTEEDK